MHSFLKVFRSIYILMTNQTFDSHLENAYKKASARISTFEIISLLKNLAQKKLINLFLRAQFNYRTHLWMLHSRKIIK